MENWHKIIHIYANKKVPLQGPWVLSRIVIVIKNSYLELIVAANKMEFETKLIPARMVANIVEPSVSAEAIKNASKFSDNLND